MKRGATGREITGRSLSIDSVLAIWKLEGDKLYPSFLVARGLFSPKDPRYQLLRKRLNLFIQYHTSGDADGKCGRFKAWRGSTWQSFLEDADVERAFETVRLTYILKERTRYLIEQECCLAGAEAEERSSSKIHFPIARVFRFPRFYKMMAAAAIIFFISVATTALIKPKTYDILRAHGLRAALTYISANKAATSPEVLYRQAWLDYRNNEHEAATQKINRILNAEISSKLRGNCYYLLGYLHISQGLFEHAFWYFQDAHESYLELDRQDLLFLSNLAMARAQTSLGNYSEAEALLEQTLTSYELSGGQGSLGALHAQRTRVAIGQARYADALVFAQKSAAAFEKDQDNDGLANAYSDLGFLYQINGDLHQGYIYTLRAQTSIVLLGDPNRHYFNLINFILLDRCRGFPANKTLVTMIQDWAAQNQDEELLYYLNLALTESCATNAEDSRLSRSTDLAELPYSQRD